jgi:hypothetical protein
MFLQFEADMKNMTDIVLGTVSIEKRKLSGEFSDHGHSAPGFHLLGQWIRAHKVDKDVP